MGEECVCVCARSAGSDEVIHSERERGRERASDTELSGMTAVLGVWLCVVFVLLSLE